STAEMHLHNCEAWRVCGQCDRSRNGSTSCLRFWQGYLEGVYHSAHCHLFVAAGECVRDGLVAVALDEMSGMSEIIFIIQSAIALCPTWGAAHRAYPEYVDGH